MPRHEIFDRIVSSIISERYLGVQRIFSLLFGFESGDDRTVKTLKVFAGVAQALFVIMFFAYCLYPLQMLK